MSCLFQLIWFIFPFLFVLYKVFFAFNFFYSNLTQFPKYLFLYVCLSSYNSRQLELWPPNSLSLLIDYWRMFLWEWIYEDHLINFQTFFVWALLLIVHTWNSSSLRSNLLWLQCTCCTIPTTSGRPHRSPLVWACQWPSSQPLSSPQFSHNNSLWA